MARRAWVRLLARYSRQLQSDVQWWHSSFYEACPWAEALLCEVSFA